MKKAVIIIVVFFSILLALAGMSLLTTGSMFFNAWRSTAVERIVHSQSYQKKAADADGIIIFQGQLDELQALLMNPELTQGDRAYLQAQQAAIRTQVKALQN